MKVKVNGIEYEYNKEKYLKGIREKFPVPDNSISRLLMSYPKDEKAFTSWFVKLYQVPEGYSVVYKVGAKVTGRSPVRGAGYRFMIGLGGLLQSAHVINTRPRLQDLVSENILTSDGVQMSKVDARLYYKVAHPEKAIAISEPDYREITFGAALARITDYIGNHRLKDTLIAKEKKTNLIFDDKGDPLTFPTVEEAGVEMLELLIIDFPLDEPTKRLIEQEAVGEAERMRRILNAQAEYQEIKHRGQAVAEVGSVIQKIPGALFLRTLETYDEFAQGPNNTIFTVPEIKLNIERMREKAENASSPPPSPPATP